jgi:hypothetical protein
MKCVPNMHQQGPFHLHIQVDLDRNGKCMPSA